MMPRRQWLAGLAALGAGASREGSGRAWAEELGLPADAPTRTIEFEARAVEGFTAVTGQWRVEEMADAPSGRNVLVQRATGNEFNVIVAPGSYADVDVTVRFKPLSG